MIPMVVIMTTTTLSFLILQIGKEHKKTIAIIEE
jgi:hypothetical protein